MWRSAQSLRDIQQQIRWLSYLSSVSKDLDHLCRHVHEGSCAPNVLDVRDGSEVGCFVDIAVVDDTFESCVHIEVGVVAGILDIRENQCAENQELLEFRQKGASRNLQSLNFQFPVQLIVYVRVKF